MTRYLFLAFCLCIINPIRSQPIADFSVLSDACLNQSVALFNSSQNSTDYLWDFNHGDLSLNPSAQNLGAISGNIPTGIDIVSDGSNWYGFVTSRSDNSIIRLDYGSSIFNSPTSVHLTGIFGSIAPTDVRIVFSEGEWFGFIYGANRLLTRLDFGTSLTNIPIVTALLNGGGGGDSGMDMVFDGTNWIIAFTGPASQVTMVRLGTIRSTPTGADMTVSTIGSGAFGDIKLIKYNGDWFGYTVNFVNKQLWKLKFGTDLLSTPVSDDITGAWIGSLTPFGIDASFDNGIFVLFISTSEGNLIKVNLGADLNNSPIAGSALGNFSGVLSNTLKLKLIKEGSRWVAFSLSWASNALFQITFPDPTSVTSLVTSTQPGPTIRYISQGSYFISLISRTVGATDEVQKNIFIQNVQAPAIDFSYTGICKQHDVFLVSNSDQTIVTYDWNFGDASGSMAINPTHQYGSSGEYIINLNVVSANTCTNFISKSIKIYDEPISSFDLPVGLICTNNEFLFTNNVVDSYDGYLSYQWLVASNPVSTTRDLEYAFTSGGSQNVTLQVSIPGCSDERTEPVAGIEIGPTVDFSSSGQCESDLISFTNGSSGSIASYFWDFGNGSTSTATDPTNIYSTKGNYRVTLQTNGTNGCISTTSKTVSVYSKPQPDFLIELPPFSCSGTPSQFTNTTPNPTDSNIASWNWNFGDEANGSATTKDPLYTFSKAGDYAVSLTATSNFGCSKIIVKVVPIAQGPTAYFTNTPACVDKGTRFTDQSGSDIKAWFWVIGNSTYSFSNPTHVFNAPGNYNAQLTVTGSNDCIATVSKPIDVPLPPVLDFSISNACEGQATIFQDTSPMGSDPVKSVLWDFVGNEKEGSPANYLFESAGTYVVKMNSTQQSGCVYTISKNVDISPTPQAKFASNPEWGTPPLAVQFTNQSVGASTYLWHFNDKSNSTSTDVSPNFQFTDLGDYVVDLTATNAQNCSNTISTKISVIIPSLDLELKDLNLIKDPASGLYRVMVTIKNRSNFVLNSADVIVDISGNARIKETVNASILPDGEVSQLLTNQIIPGSFFTYLCAELDVANDLDLLNNKKCEPVIDEGVIFLPYPNPSEGEFQFDWIPLAEETAHVTIFNSMGQIVAEHDLTATSGVLNQARFDLRSQSNGTYFFKFKTKSLSKTIPITILR